jgi:signal transduction histidine kinase
MRQERLTWLESLARFLRHELKNQMVAMGTSIDMIEHAPPDAPPERYLARARRSLGRMGSLVQSATEATSIEAALTTGPNERLDLSGLVEERVFVFREAYPQRRFLTEIEPELELEGQEDRIAQLVDKLLDNAVEHGFEGGEVRVALMRADGWLLLAVENEGDPLPRDKQALFDAFVSDKKSGNGRQNVGLGLFVARAIAQSHAGHIQALDIDGPSGARFEVRFPSEVK